MELKIKKRIVLPGIPSASGVECQGKFLYITGDNSPYLFKLDKRYRTIAKIPIFSTENAQNDTIAKIHKPDFEAMTIAATDEKEMLYIFGSGSKRPHRDVLLAINLDEPHHPSEYPLSAFYDKIRQQCGFTADDFNIEAALFTGTSFVLMNRATNDLIHFDKMSFDRFLAGQTDLPEFHCTHFQLPGINGVEARFSGGTYLPSTGHIVFTASVENTANWIDDGEVPGSFVGIITPEGLDGKSAPVCIPITKDGNPVPLKIESASVLSVHKKFVRLLLVSDNDQGQSELLEADLFFDF